MYKFNFIIIINMLIKQNYLLNLPKYDTRSGLTEMNSLATITLSISSVRSLCTCSNIQLFSRFSVIVDLRYVRRRFSTEKIHSLVEDVIGIVKYNLSNLWTLEAKDLYTLFEFIASHTVRIYRQMFPNQAENDKKADLPMNVWERHILEITRYDKRW